MVEQQEVYLVVSYAERDCAGTHAYFFQSKEAATEFLESVKDGTPYRLIKGEVLVETLGV